MVARTTLDASHEASTSQGWAWAYRRLIDAAVAILVFAYDLLFLVSMLVGGEFTPLMFVTALVLSLAICVLYLFRHRSLPWTFAGMFTAAAAQVAIGIGLAPASVTVLGFMLYAIGSWGTWRLLIPAVVLTAGWTVLAGIPVVRDDRARVGEIGMLMLAYVLVALVGRLLRGRRERFEALQARAEQLTRERDAQAAIAAAEERTRIAREIHDIVSHSLGTMVVMADGAAQTATADPEQAGVAMAQVRDTGRDAMNEMRRMLGSCAPLIPQVVRRSLGWARWIGWWRRCVRRGCGSMSQLRACRCSCRRVSICRVPDRAGGADERAQARRAAVELGEGVRDLPTRCSGPHHH